MKTRAVLFAVGLMLSGAALNALPAQAQLFGESDEEKAARLAHEDGQDAQIKPAWHARAAARGQGAQPYRNLFPPLPAPMSN